MSRIETYTPYLTVAIRHGYYSSAPPVCLEPDSVTSSFFRRSGYILRPLGSECWTVLRPQGRPPEEFHPTFRVIPTDPLFHYVTERAEAQGAELEIVRQPGTWALLRTTEESVELELHPPARKLEFILIPRHTDPTSRIALREAQNRVTFSPPELLPPGTHFGTAWRTTTDEQVILTENPPHRFQLWEVRPRGECLLADRVPFPRPRESSLSDPHNTITTYFYY